MTGIAIAVDGVTSDPFAESRPSSGSTTADTTGLSACSMAKRALRAARALVAVARRDTHWTSADIGDAIWVERGLWVEKG